ncbi:MAG: sugar ABC transporter permease [Actinomycetota bacterium]
MGKQIKRKWKLPIGTIMLLPTNVIMFFLIIIPTILVIWFSVINFQPNLGLNFWESRFIFLENYIKIFQDKEFIYALIRTVGISVVCLAIEFTIGLLIASILTGKIFGKVVLFPILIIPLMIPPIVVGNNFWLIFSANGPINQIISNILNTEFTVSWLSHPTFAMIPIMLSEIWHWYPLTFLILFSGLANVSISEIRAAQVLGANEWQIFRRIKLPKLKGIIAIALVIRMMEALKVFDTIHLLTRGGPGTNTETLSYYLFKEGFQYSRVSYISAGAWIILFVSLLGFSFALRTIFIKER